MPEKNMQEFGEARDQKPMLLLEKGKKGLFRVLFSRTGIILIFFLLGVLLILLPIYWLAEWLPQYVGLAMVVQFLLILFLVNSEMDSTSKITWLLVMLIFPLVGGFFYLYTRRDLGSRVVRAALKDKSKKIREVLPEESAGYKALKEESLSTAALAKYIAGTGNYPVYKDTAVTYYPLGEHVFHAMLEDLEKAEHFIFLEFFIVDEGEMWGEILAILARKAAQGLDVRVMYDGTCEFSTLPHDYPDRLKALGIQCRVFSPMTPLVSTYYNYRDHRKIMVIDGRIAYNGGVNLADEYINAIDKYGHWKDTAIRLEGPGVDSFTVMFMEMWGLLNPELDVERFVGHALPVPDAPGYVIPYGDNPMDADKVGENVYMDFLYRAKSYVHVMSPYLILDDEMLAALKMAGQKGIDVKLILPGIPDKKIPYDLARSYFSTLLKSSVKIYLYDPGFVHAKVFVSDDIRAVVGTINLDYRSLYHHFECATYLYKVPCIPDIEADFQKTLLQCHQVTPEEIKNLNLGSKAIGWLFRMIAPLL